MLPLQVASQDAQCVIHRTYPLKTDAYTHVNLMNILWLNSPIVYLLMSKIMVILK